MFLKCRLFVQTYLSKSIMRPIGSKQKQYAAVCHVANKNEEQYYYTFSDLKKHEEQYYDNFQGNPG